MLANVLAENFSSIETIDWKLVSKFPEFSGFTVETLRVVFFSSLLPCASKRLNIDRFDLTLKQVSENAVENFQHLRVNKMVEQRQKDVIGYFENAVKELNIKDFVSILH